MTNHSPTHRIQASTKIILFWLVIGICSRLIPHPPNATPLIALSLFIGSNLPRYQSLAVMGIIIAVSDLLLSLLFDYPAFGIWTIFTYSAFFAFTWAGNRYIHGPLRASTHPHNSKIISARNILLWALLSPLAFWLWTNFGVWLQGYYPTTWHGLITAYVNALPFLRNNMIGTLVWVCLFSGCLKATSRNRYRGASARQKSPKKRSLHTSK